MIKKASSPAPLPYRLYAEDCVPGLGRRIKYGEPTLAINDPPYNFGQLYDGYSDKRTDYWDWTKQWLTATHRVLHPHGALWVFVPDEWVSAVDTYCREVLKMTRRNWCIWTFSFGQAAKKSFTRSHLHVLYFAKHKTKYTFNADALKVPSARQLVYGDKRAKSGGKLPDDTWALLKQDIELRLPEAGDVWPHSRICGTFKARQAHSPNQLPLSLVERIVKACSNPGDLVLDPFNGTGTSGVAALKLGRRYVGFDVSKKSIEETTKLLERTRGELAGTGPGAQRFLFEAPTRKRGEVPKFVTKSVKPPTRRGCIKT